MGGEHGLVNKMDSNKNVGGRKRRSKHHTDQATPMQKKTQKKKKEKKAKTIGDDARIDHKIGGETEKNHRGVRSDKLT